MLYHDDHKLFKNKCFNIAFYLYTLYFMLLEFYSKTVYIIKSQSSYVACGPTIVKVVLSFANVSSNCQQGMGQFGGVGASGTNATKRAVLCVGRKYVRRQH